MSQPIATASGERLAPIDRVVVPLALIGLEPFARDRVADRVFQTRLDVTGDHSDSPGLDVAAAGAARGELEQIFDSRAINCRWQEGPDGAACPDRLVDGC
jgi:hypothetical protein